jgi:hypothetical protein
LPDVYEDDKCKDYMQSWAYKLDNYVCKKYPDGSSYKDYLTSNKLILKTFPTSDCSGDPSVQFKAIPKEQLSLTTCTELNQLLGFEDLANHYGRIYSMNENVPGAKGAKYNYKEPKEPKK